MTDEEQLAACLQLALERIDAGGSVDLPALCGDRQDLVPLVAEALGLRQGLGALRRAAAAAPGVLGQLLVGRYRLDGELGRGAAGTVYRAHDLLLQRPVAVKLLHQGAFAAAETRQRFQREAEVLAQHAHPHIVRVHDVGISEEQAPFLVTELLVGRSLFEVLQASRAAMPDGASARAFDDSAWLTRLLPAANLDACYLRQVVAWAEQLAAGLGAAHERGVCHRDVKPSNVFVRDDGTAVLLDFGIAARSGDPELTLPHAVVGTPCYMAPEQAAGRLVPGPSIDVYGLAATLYHLLTLRPPHSGDLQQVLLAVRTEAPRPAAESHPGLPRDLQAILDHGLEADPRRRYPTMAAFGEDLRAFLAHRPVSVRPLNPLQRATRACQRRPARTAAAALGALAVSLLLLVAPLWSVVRAGQRSAERQHLLAALPADLCIEGQPSERLLVPLAERGVVLAELDRLLELEPGDLAVRLLRAAERLDAGDHSGAAADFAALQAVADSPFLRAAAARYAAAAAGGALDVDALPEPTTATDCFVAGFHAMRRHDFELGYELLGRCGDFVPARDLRLLAACGRARPDAELLLHEAGWLEGHYGRRTARTRHAMAVAMLLRRRWDAAITHAEQSLALRPDRHGPWNNLALAHLRSGHLDEARRCYERAVAMRPWFANSLGGLAQTLRRLGDFDGAARTAAAIQDDSWRAHELGNLAVARAVAAGAHGDHPARQAFAAEAARQFRAAAAVPADRTRNPAWRALPAALAHAEALGAPDPATAVRSFAAQLRGDPLNAQQLANLAGLLCEADPDRAGCEAIALLLVEQALALAPEDRQLLAERERLRAATATNR